MSKDDPVANLDKSRCCRARMPFGIRDVSWVLIMLLRTESQNTTAYCTGLSNLFLVSTKHRRQVLT